MVAWKNRHYAFLLVLLVLCLAVGCQSAAPEKPNASDGGATLSQTFDPENPHEYGIKGIYLGEGIKEAMELLKPEKYDFMDAATRASLTVDQLAEGKGSVATGILLVDKTQVLLKVAKGTVQSIVLGGVPEEESKSFATNRGVAVYDSVDQVKKMYGETSGEKELIYKGSTYQITFIANEGKVIGIRFDPV